MNFRIIERQDERIKTLDSSISLTNIIITGFGVLITILVIFFSFRAEGVAKAQASGEIKEWLLEKGKNELDKLVGKSKENLEGTVKEFENKMDKYENEATKRLEGIKEKEINQVFANFASKNGNITDDEKRKIKEVSKDIMNIEEEYMTIEQWKELFLSAYYNHTYDDAIKYSKIIIQKNPKDYTAYSNMGLAYDKKGDYKKAIGSYEKTIEINPKFDNAYTNLFEMQLIKEQSFDKEIETQYLSLFTKKIDSFMLYEMLKLLVLIVRNEEVDLDKWLNTYKEEKLSKNWSFSELEKWANTKEESVKTKLLNAIKTFKTKL